MPILYQILSLRPINFVFANLSYLFRKTRMRLWLLNRQQRPLETVAYFGSHERSEWLEPVIVSFGTKDGIYDHAIERLRESAEKVEQPNSLDLIPQADRHFATQFKPNYIKTKLLTLQAPVVWLDADTCIKEKLLLPDSDWDFGCIDLPRKKKGKGVKAGDCLAFRPTLKALKFLELWEYVCIENVKRQSDHPNLLFARDIPGLDYTEIDIMPYVQNRLIRGHRGKLTEDI